MSMGRKEVAQVESCRLQRSNNRWGSASSPGCSSPAAVPINGTASVGTGSRLRSMSRRCSSTTACTYTWAPCGEIVDRGKDIEGIARDLHAAGAVLIALFDWMWLRGVEPVGVKSVQIQWRAALCCRRAYGGLCYFPADWIVLALPFPWQTPSVRQPNQTSTAPRIAASVCQLCGCHTHMLVLMQFLLLGRALVASYLGSA